MKKIIIIFFTIASSIVGTLAQQVVYLDFGATAASGNYNTSIIYNNVSNLIDNTGATTGIAFVWTQNFSGGNTNGPASTTGAALAAFPDASLTSDFVYGSSANLNASFKLTGLDQSKYYNFLIFGGRASGGDVKSTRYTITGLNTAKDSLDAALNSTTVATIYNIVPDANGEIRFATTKATTNTSSSGYYYLNAVKMTINSNITTSLPATSEKKLNAIYKNNLLYLENYNGKASVYSLTGECIDNIYFVSGVAALKLSKGLYILKSNTGNMKFTVK